MKIECVETRTPHRCYTISTYKVTSDKDLTVIDLKDLRDSGKLGYGQNIGALMKTYKENDNFIYLFQTTCDSGD